MDGYSIECYSFQVQVEYLDRAGHMLARLCRRHDTKDARETAEAMGLTRIEL